MLSSLTEVSIHTMTKASYRARAVTYCPLFLVQSPCWPQARGWQSVGNQSGEKAIATVKMRYIFRCNRAKQLPWSVGQWGLPLQVEHALFFSTFQKSMIFKKLAKMTVENLCKSAKFCNRLPTDCHPKMATYDNSCRIATRNAPFSGEPLHFISG